VKALSLPNTHLPQGVDIRQFIITDALPMIDWKESQATMDEVKIDKTTFDACIAHISSVISSFNPSRVVFCGYPGHFIGTLLP
jgi:hypothetical protein